MLTSRSEGHSGTQAIIRRDVPLAVLLHVPGALSILIYVATARELSRLGYCLMLALAASAVGGLLGFLFGIPRAFQQPAPLSQVAPAATPGNDAGRPDHRPLGYQQSTNLEQISDWLTKILLGVGLTQLTRAPQKLLALAHWFDGTVGPVSVTLSILIYFLVVGFISGWMITRLRLLALFEEADDEARRAAERKAQAIETLAAADLGAQIDPQRPIMLAEAQASAAAHLARQELATQTTVAEMIAWARARLASGDPMAAVRGYREALQRDPGNVNTRVELAVALSRLKDHENALSELDGARQYTDDAWFEDKLRISKAIVFNALYGPPPDGFERAIEEAQAYLKQRTSTSVLAYLTCGLGQKYRYLRDRDAKPAELQAVRTAALDALRRAMARPDADEWRGILHSLLRPSPVDKQSGEDDLEVWKDDPDFERVLGPVGPAIHTVTG